MTYDDFCRCTPDEFNSVCEAYHDQRMADYKDAWERMRVLAAITIQPHVKNKITPQKLLHFSWDKEKNGYKADHLTMKERKERLNEALAKFGNTY